MSQKVDSSIFKEVEKEMNKKRELEGKMIISNSGKQSNGGWVKDIVEVVKISELAKQKNVEKCPKCAYSLQFDDDRGWFICVNARYSGKENCDFCGNIVDFVYFLMEERRW